LADYNGHGQSDIPVNKSHNTSDSGSNNRDVYIDMVRRANAKAAAEKANQQFVQPQPQQVQRQQYVQPQQQMQNPQYAQPQPQQMQRQQYVQPQQQMQNPQYVQPQPQQVQRQQYVQPQQRMQNQQYAQPQPQQVQRQQYVQPQQQIQNQRYVQPQPRPVQRQQYVQPNQQQVYNQPNVQVSPRQKNFDDYKKEFDIKQKTANKRQSQSAEFSKGGASGELPKRRKRRGVFWKVLLSLFLVVVIAFGAVTGYIYSFFTKVEYNGTGENDSLDSIINILDKEYVYNILLIGVDERNDDENSRSDTMMLISIDKKNEQIKMLSFMRDTWVEIPGHGYAKMNAACRYGGAELVMETIDHNFDVKVDNYILVDFEAFKDIVDSLGGVTVEVEEREAEFINETTRQNIDYGEEVELNGEEALVYVRIRKLDSDFYRTQRQRKVISAIIESAKNANPLDLLDMAENVMQYIETDMSPLQLTVFAESALFCIKYEIVQSRVPFDGEYANETIDGQAVLSIDIDETRELVDEFIYEKVEEEEKDD